MTKIPLFRVNMPPAIALMPQLEKVLYSGFIAEGEQVAAFEEKFGRYIGNPWVIAVNSGTAALHVALLLAGVSVGDEVISTPITAEPTNMAIRYAGGRIVWADVDPRNGNVTAEGIAAKITPSTKAVMVVHYGGVPAPLQDIRAVADEHNLPVIEDAAHALGARYGGQPIGRHSEFVMFSFQAIKHLTTVDGGMLACRRAEDARCGRLLRWFGIDRQVERTTLDVAAVGYKYNMNNVTATIGMIQLDHIQQVIDRHVANGRYFDHALQDSDGLETCRWHQAAEPSYWFYTVLVERQADFIRYLEEHGVAASTAHKRNDLHSVFADSRCALPGVDAFYERMVHIPCGWWVSDEDREYIADIIRKGW